MKILSERRVSDSLLIYEHLLARKNDLYEEVEQYERLFKGFVGEMTLSEFLKEVDEEKCLTLFDCLFEVEQKEIQIDCILLTSDTIYLLEVKNYNGDYYFQNNKIYHIRTNKEIFNPINQLERTQFLFQQLLQEMRMEYKVQSHIVFVNPSFWLYHAPYQASFVYPPQIRRFLSKISQNASPLTSDIHSFAKELLQRTKTYSNDDLLASIRLEEMKRGVFCEKCHKKLERVGKQYFSCAPCQESYKVDDVLLYAIAQFNLLFPELEMTTGLIVDWCGNMFSRVFVSRFLGRSLQMVRYGRFTHYIFKDKDEPVKLLTEKFYQNRWEDLQSSGRF